MSEKSVCVHTLSSTQVNFPRTGIKFHPIEGVQEQAEALKLQNTSLKSENDWLKQQLAQSRPASENAISFLSAASLQATSLDMGETARSGITAAIQAALARVKLQLNPTLSRIIRTAPEATILKAIDALQEAMAAGTIERPGGWLKRAIEESWQPNEESSPQIDPKTSLFNQWFALARIQGIVAASLQGENGQMWVFDREGVRYGFEQMLVMYPLEQLKEQK